MSKNVFAVFIRYPVATCLMTVGILFAGVAAYFHLPVAPLPQVEFPTIQVSAVLPGADPVSVASTLAQPLETQFSKIPYVTQMTSQSTLSSTSIVLQFSLDRSIDAAANDVQSAIDAAAAQLPNDLPSPPTFQKVNPADAPIMLLSATSATLPLTTIDDYVETRLTKSLSQIDGVGSVSIGGQQKPSIRIQLDPLKLSARGLSFEEVRHALTGLSGVNPKGVLNGTMRSYTIYTNGQMTEPAQWNNAIVAYRDGAPVRVSDIGRAVLGPEDNTLAAWIDGKRAISVGIYKKPGANTVATVDQIRARLPELEASLPPSLKVTVLADRTQTIRASLLDIELTLLLNVVLVVLVIYAFLGSARTTLIPAITVPVSLFGACALMWAFGYSLDNISLMAMTIAVGFVVDDAIVMVENIARHVERGEPPLQAALKGLSETSFTIASISISLVAVLLPLLLMAGIIGRMFREFAVTLSMTILVSAFVSLTLTPMMAAYLLRARRPGHEHKAPRPGLFERGFARMAATYERYLDLALKHRFITLCVFFASVAASVVLYAGIPKGFFPQQDTGVISGVSEAAQNISVEDMARRSMALQAIIRADPAVEHCQMAVGGSAYAGTTVNNGRWYITLKPRDQRDVSADEVIRRLRPQFAQVPGVRMYLQAAQDVIIGARLARTQYQLTLQSPDVGALTSWSPRLLAKLSALPQLRDVASDQQVNGSALSVSIDRDQAARYGLTPEQIDGTLYDAFGSRQIAQYFTQLSTYKVVMEAPPALQRDPTTLDRIYMKAPSGDQVPLSSVARWTTDSVQPLSVNHQAHFPSVTISFNLAPHASLGEATAAVEAAQAQLDMPPTIVSSFQGTAQAFQSTLATMPILIGAALVVAYLVLGALYGSFIHPWTILSTLPSAGVGAIATLWLFKYDFNLIALIGVILLIGIVKKNGIMMVDFAIAATREQHMSSFDAIRSACLLRFRPIMMTTMTALFGALPLLFASGMGSELRRPLGYAMVGGLLVSQMLTLFTTPVIYLYLDTLSNRLKVWFQPHDGDMAPEPAAEDAVQE
ncbi:acriflavine resistance protein B [Paraburkholderia acidicola]|uniref:Acriflavine resistance protein B n=1 Tax=Paraburkholderia acidicola TaxID=1912599 RepID=A0A1I9RH05_9BURK|nr:efflux RND transporter permease subunit [Paraburkholderia acidicola]AOZ21312.1 SulE [Paraburkholderia acidicola]PCE22696.1 acriflavine resistance protein B [Paraburkholderia acidicola]